MHSLEAANRARSLPLLALALFLTAIGCGGAGATNGSHHAGGESSGGDASSSGEQSNAGASSAGDESNGGEASSGGDTSQGGAPNGDSDGGGAAGGALSNAGTGGGDGATGARSCETDCEDLANTSCAEPDFSIESCVPECERAAQEKIEDAREIGCLTQYLALDLCRADDPVCTHPNPAECVEQNDAYVACLENAI